MTSSWLKKKYERAAAKKVRPSGQRSRIKRLLRSKIIVSLFGLVGTLASAWAMHFLGPDSTKTGPGAASPSTSAASPRQTKVSKNVDIVKVDGVRVTRTNDETQWASPDAITLTAGELKKLNNAEDENEWLKRRGAVDLGFTSIQIIVESNIDGDARITDIRPIKKCTKPLSGTLFDSPSAGSEPSIGLTFDLDQTTPSATYQTKDYKTVDYFSNKTIHLYRGETRAIQVRAQTDLSYCEFTLKVLATAGQESRDQQITNNGDPFKVTSMAGPIKRVNYSGNRVPPFRDGISKYKRLYVGGVLTQESGGGWVRKNPTTYKGPN